MKTRRTLLTLLSIGAISLAGCSQIKPEERNPIAIKYACGHLIRGYKGRDGRLNKIVVTTCHERGRNLLDPDSHVVKSTYLPEDPLFWYFLPDLDSTTTK